jgi:hypothetical protein
MTAKKLTLTTFVKRYSQANQTEYEVLVAAVNKLDPHSSAHQVAVQALEKWREFEAYLEAAGFEL